MNGRNFRELLEAQWSRGNFVCVGLDSELGKIPEVLPRNSLFPPGLGAISQTFFAFNAAIVDATCDLVCAYKPNIAFYEALGDVGWLALRETIAHIHSVAPDVPVILDAKRADIGNTNAGYLTAAFYMLAADAITVHPYLGREALQIFLGHEDRGIFVLCRTSNPGAGELQDLVVQNPEYPDWGGRGEPLYKIVARNVCARWNTKHNCGLVVGATYPEELEGVRSIVGDMPILIPGIGAQGGDVEKTVRAGKDSRGRGMIINASRSIIFASSGADFAEAARRETEKLRDLINQYR